MSQFFIAFYFVGWILLACIALYVGKKKKQLKLELKRQGNILLSAISLILALYFTFFALLFMPEFVRFIDNFIMQANPSPYVTRVLAFGILPYMIGVVYIFFKIIRTQWIKYTETEQNIIKLEKKITKEKILKFFHINTKNKSEKNKQIDGGLNAKGK